jgi:hypothetical protein
MRRVKRSRKTGSIAKVAGLAIAAPQVVAIRTARMLAAGANPGAADRAEFSRMANEKVQAWWESLFAMGTQIVKANQEYARTAAVQCWRLWTTPAWLGLYPPLLQRMMSLPQAGRLIASRGQHDRAMSRLLEAGLTPIHKRATANARRLGRIKKR